MTHRQLKVKRPSDYVAPASAGPDPTANPNLYAAVNGLAKIKVTAHPLLSHVLHCIAPRRFTRPARSFAHGPRILYYQGVVSTTVTILLRLLFYYITILYYQGVVSTTVEDGPNKLYLGNLPNHLGPEQVNVATCHGRAVVVVVPCRTTWGPSR